MLKEICNTFFEWQQKEVDKIFCVCVVCGWYDKIFNYERGYIILIYGWKYHTFMGCHKFRGSCTFFGDIIDFEDCDWNELRERKRDWNWKISIKIYLFINYPINENLISSITKQNNCTLYMIFLTDFSLTSLFMIWPKIVMISRPFFQIIPE